MAFAIGSTATSAGGLRATAQSSAPAQSVSSASVAQTAVSRTSRKWKRESALALVVLLAALLAIPAVRHRISSLWEKPQPTSNAANVAVPDNPFCPAHPGPDLPGALGPRGQCGPFHHAAESRH